MSSDPALHPDRGPGAAYLRLVLLGAAIGIPAALVASLFLAVVHWMEDLLWTDLPEALGHEVAPWWLIVLLPVLGAAIVVAARRLLPGDGGHTPLLGIGGAPTPWQYAPGIALAAVGTLAFGAILGPEAPLIALGSAVGMVVVSWSRATGAEESVLSTAGSFSAVSALFGGPLVAAMLLVEGGLAAGAALVPALVPGLTAAAVGYVLFTGLGSWGGLDAAGLAVPHLSDYEGTRLVDLALAIIVGILTAALLHVVRRSSVSLERTTTAGGPDRMSLALLAGGLVVGLLAAAMTAFDVDPHEVLFSGQAAVPSILAETSLGLLLLIIAVKAIGYAVCLGCGFRGGPVFPAVFLGVGVATLCCILFDCSPTWALAVGAAAGTTAGTNLVFSALLFALLLTGTDGLDALPAAVLAVVAAWLTNGALRTRFGQATFSE